MACLYPLAFTAAYEGERTGKLRVWDPSVPRTGSDPDVSVETDDAHFLLGGTQSFPGLDPPRDTAGALQGSTFVAGCGCSVSGFGSIHFWAGEKQSTKHHSGLVRETSQSQGGLSGKVKMATILAVDLTTWLAETLSAGIASGSSFFHVLTWFIPLSKVRFC